MAFDSYLEFTHSLLRLHVIRNTVRLSDNDNLALQTYTRLEKAPSARL